MYDIPTDALSRFSVSGRITGLIFNSEGDTLIVLGSDVVALNPTTGEKLASIFAGEAQQGTLAMTPNNLIIGSANSMAAGETFKIPSAWMFGDKRLIPRQDFFSKKMGHKSMIHAVATSPDGSLLAAESNGTIRLWNLRKREPVGNKMCGHTGRVAGMKFSPDGKTTGLWVMGWNDSYLGNPFRSVAARA